jgi:hypothetical protein
MRLLDTNVFITAKNTYYGLDLVPAFWSWLDEQAAAREVASTDMVYDELRDGNDDLADRVKGRKELLFHVDSTSAEVAGHVASLGAWAQAAGYKQHVVEDFLDCADPFLVGPAAESGLIVVTLETPAGSKRRKIKIPDACALLGVSHENTFDMMRAVGARFT